MMISEHKTRSVFDRYYIVNDDQLQNAAKKMERGAKADARALNRGQVRVSETTVVARPSLVN